MVRRTLFFLFLSGAGIMTGGAQNDPFRNYIDQYKTLAVSEMERTGIPASIKLAQALLESNAGRSDLAVKGNNHFGIKCGSDWNGKTYKKIDDEQTRLGLPKKSCFRHYRSVEESFIAHSEFLTDPRKESRYGFLFDLDPTDYKEWAKGLKKAGYATSSDYPRKLIDIIEKYDLNKLDKMTAADLIAQRDDRRRDKQKDKEDNNTPQPKPATQPEKPTAAAAFETGVLNDVRFVVARQDQTVAELARQADQPARDLLRYNENLTREDQVVPGGERVFLQPKRSSFRGRQQWHTVAEGEDLLAISQLYAVGLDHLQERNRLNSGEEPAVGAKIKLRGGPVDQAPPTRQVQPEKPSEEPKPSRPVITSTTDEGDRLDIEIEGGKPAPAKPSTSKPGTPPATSSTTTTPAPRPDTATSQRPATGADPFGGPAPAAQPAPNADPVYHLVASGDTLWSISQRYQTTVDQVKKLNNLSSNQIRSGERLRVR